MNWTGKTTEVSTLERGGVWGGGVAERDQAESLWGLTYIALLSKKLLAKREGRTSEKGGCATSIRKNTNLKTAFRRDKTFWENGVSGEGVPSQILKKTKREGSRGLREGED